MGGGGPAGVAADGGVGEVEVFAPAHGGRELEVGSMGWVLMEAICDELV